MTDNLPPGCTDAMIDAIADYRQCPVCVASECRYAIIGVLEQYGIADLEKWSDGLRDIAEAAADKVHEDGARYCAKHTQPKGEEDL